MYSFKGLMNGYVFYGTDKKTGKVLFNDAFWYVSCPSVAELDRDLENYVREQGMVYNYENETRLAFDGFYETINFCADDGEEIELL